MQRSGKKIAALVETSAAAFHAHLQKRIAEVGVEVSDWELAVRAL